MLLPLILLPSILLVAAPAAAAPPAREQFGADCLAPVYASDRLVCSDPLLLALDERMRSIGAAVDVTAVLSSETWVETQVAWFRRRSLCAFSERHAACLQGAYLERIAVLDGLRALASAPSRTFAPAHCAEPSWQRFAVRMSLPRSSADTLAVDDGKGRALAVAMQAPADGYWAPYTVFDDIGRTFRLTRSGDKANTCRLVEAR